MSKNAKPSWLRALLKLLVLSCHGYYMTLRFLRFFTEKDFRPTKYSPEKILDPRSTHEEKLQTHEEPSRKNFGPTKYPRGRILDTQNTPEKKFQTHEIPARKNFGHTKYPPEKILDPQEKKFRTQEIPTRKKFWTHESTVAPWREIQETHDGTRPTEFSALCSFKTFTKMYLPI